MAMKLADIIEARNLYGQHVEPCPFGTPCDEECLDILVMRDEMGRPNIYQGRVVCHDCGSTGPTVWAEGDTETASLAAYSWNDRDRSPAAAFDRGETDGEHL